MKTNMKKRIQSTIKVAAVLFMLPLAFSCQSEQEVGTMLYPTTGDDYSQIAFVDNHAYGFKNMKWTTYARAGSQDVLDIPADTLRFNVQLTTPAEKDLTFKLKIDNSKINQDYADYYAVMDEEALKMENETVVIKQGQMKSEQPFKVALNEKSKALLDMDEDKIGIVVFSFESADGVKISEKYNTYSWELYKEVHWVNPKGSIANLQAIDVQTYSVNSGFYGNSGTQLSDNDITNYARYLITTNEQNFLRVDFNAETEFSAIQLTPCGTMYGQNLGLNFTKEIEILGSSDGQTYSRLGFATNPTEPTNAQEPWNIVFYSAQKVKHIKIRTISTFQGSEVNSPVFLSEMKILK